MKNLAWPEDEEGRVGYKEGSVDKFETGLHG